MYSTGSPGAESWHEAGHAVVAHMLGGRVRRITLEIDEDPIGGQASIEWRSMDARAFAEVSACTSLGGPLAELAFAGSTESPTPQVLATWRADWEEVIRCVARVATDSVQRDESLRNWVRKTWVLLASPDVLESVARVADALDAHGTLDEALFAEAIS